jgi:hypothetical protein
VATRSLLEMENRTTTEGVRSTIGLNSEIYSYCGADLVGGDQFVARYPNPDLCVTNCLAQTGCNAATWTKFEGGTCYFKRIVTGPGAAQMVHAVPNAGAVSFLRPESGVTPVFLAPCYGDVDMPGNDLTSVHGENTQRCDDACLSNEKCYGYTWSPYNGGTCWLKTKASPFVPSPGATSCITPNIRNPSACIL